MNRHPALSLDLDDGIDRKVLGQLRQRFLAVNAGRLQRARQALSSRQERVLRLLPLLFHINHPLLPGYLSASTPAGLSGFEADDEVLAEAQRLARSFVYKPRRQEPAQQPIHGLFLMGSLGSLAQEEQSDLDLWVCHAPELEPGARQELRRKCALIEDWARSQGSEVHCFLIDVARFGQDERKDWKESGGDGNTQHFLLLDEFYRSAIWLGGRTPLWWLVPPAHERRYDEYCRTLLGKRFIRAEEVLDLGHLAHIPAREFIGAGLWQLSKAIDSPYKSLLKLLLTEAYASEHPRVRCVALRFKEQVFAGQLDLDELDPYVLVYRHLERYLREQQAPEPGTRAALPVPQGRAQARRSPAPGAEGLAAPVDGAARRGMAMGASPLGPARQPQPVEDAPGDGRASHGGQRTDLQLPPAVPDRPPARR